ncbi:hypothetical protein [Serratia sp. UGAL515B_01]|uniref:hypothetical protein n=1 Tax=Serratia sp. UGAL515B_01 TaxID=2986763 RepID=UPI00295441F0|nr:hypothetical protein [Serratia sp. UGAL515B_01]WON77788.1 hypothetical protein OK023_03610 [Serratia sp. UGAL515B_01]
MLQVAIKYFFIAFILSLIIVLINTFSATGEIYGFWHGVKILFWLTAGPGTGMLIGGFVRQWLMPDAIYTREGAVGIFKAKLFWSIGPQSIGWLIGVLAVSERLY